MPGYASVTLYLESDDQPYVAFTTGRKAASVRVYSGTGIHSSDPDAFRALASALIEAAEGLEAARSVPNFSPAATGR